MPDCMIAWRRPHPSSALCCPSDTATPHDRHFHAVDTATGCILCDPHTCLAASYGEPNEGSRICPNCAAIVRGAIADAAVPDA